MAALLWITTDEELSRLTAGQVDEETPYHEASLAAEILEEA